MSEKKTAPKQTSAPILELEKKASAPIYELEKKAPASGPILELEKKSQLSNEQKIEQGKVEIMKVVEGVQGAEKLAELIERGNKKGKLSAS